MSVVNREITLDLLDKTSSIKVYAKRLDDMARHLKISIKRGADVYTIPTDAHIAFQGTKPDNTHFCNDNLVNEDGSYDVKVNEDNTLDVVLTDEILAVTGNASCEIEIEDSNGLITSSTFKLNIVEKALSPDVVHSTDEYRSMYKMLLESRDLAAGILGDAEHCSQKADEAKSWAQLADDVVNCVPLANIADNFTTTTAEHVLSAAAGKRLNDGKVDKVDGKGLSAEDFTSAYKEKLDTIDSSAKNTQIVDNLLSSSATSALSANQGRVLDNKIISANTAISGLNGKSLVTYGSTVNGQKEKDILFKDDGHIQVFSNGEWINYFPKTRSERIFGKITYSAGVTNQSNASGIVKDLNTGMCILSVGCTLTAKGGAWESVGYVPSGFMPIPIGGSTGQTGSEDGEAIGSVVITDGGTTITGAEFVVDSEGKISFKSAGTVGFRWLIGSIIYFTDQ